MTSAKVLKPVLRAFDSIEGTGAIVLGIHYSRFGTCGGKATGDMDITLEITGVVAGAAVGPPGDAIAATGSGSAIGANAVAGSPYAVSASASAGSVYAVVAGAIDAGAVDAGAGADYAILADNLSQVSGFDP